jgi:hypothetical protein
LVLGALALGVVAGDGGAHTIASSPAGTRMEAHVDPASGRLVPVPIEPEEAVAPAALPTPVESSAPGGGVMSVVPPQYRSRLVATVAADGSVHVDCVVPAEQRRP